jgi:hypothetical protein
VRGKVMDEAIFTGMRVCACMTNSWAPLPRELSEPQRAALVQAVMGELTGAALPPRAASGSPTIHIGPRAQHIDREVGRPSSRTVRHPTPGHPERVIDYPRIDAECARRERNAEIANIKHAVLSARFETRVLEADRSAAVHARRMARHAFRERVLALRARGDAAAALASG